METYINISLKNPRFSLETPIFPLETPDSRRRPQHVHWRLPNFHWRPPDSRWRPPYFHKRPQIFIEDPQIFIRDPKFHVGTHYIFMETIIFSFWTTPRLSEETPYLRWRLPYFRCKNILTVKYLYLIKKKIQVCVIKKKKIFWPFHFFCPIAEFLMC